MRARGVLAVLLSTALLGVPPAVAAEPDATADAGRDTPPPVTPAERAAALAEPAVVLVDVRWEGYVVDRDSYARLDDEPVTVAAQCTGAGVGGEGYLVTTASCVQQSTIMTEAFRQVVDRRVADGRTPADQAGDLLSHLAVTAMLGSEPSDPDPPERTVTVRRTVTDDAPMIATVVAVARPADGDAALIRIDRAHQPILPLAGEINPGDEVVTLEVPTPDAGTGGPPPSPTTEPVQPRFRVGMVTETQPRVLVAPPDDADPRPAVPSGLVINHDGALVGLVDVSLTERDVLVGADVIRDLLESAEVQTEPGQVDSDFRAGLDAYYDGSYTESIERFDAVLAIIPSHLQAHGFRQRAQERRAEQGGEPPAPVDDVMNRLDHWINGQSGSLVGLAVLLAILFFLLRRRHPHLDADPRTPGQADAPEAPPSPEDASKISG